MIEITWACSANRTSFSPTARAVRPPTPASTSSSTSVSGPPCALAATLIASAIRDSSPPEAVLASGAGSSPVLAASRSSQRSLPRCPSGASVSSTTSFAPSMPRSASSCSTTAVNSAIAPGTGGVKLARDLPGSFFGGPLGGLELRHGLARLLEQLERGACFVGQLQHPLERCAKAALEFGKQLEPALDRLEPGRVGLEVGGVASKRGHRLLQPQPGIAQFGRDRGQCGLEGLTRGDELRGACDQRLRALALVGREQVESHR